MKKEETNDLDKSFLNDRSICYTTRQNMLFDIQKRGKEKVKKPKEKASMEVKEDGD